MRDMKIEHCKKTHADVRLRLRGECLRCFSRIVVDEV